LIKTSPQKLYRSLQKASSKKKPEYIQAADIIIRFFLMKLFEEIYIIFGEGFIKGHPTALQRDQTRRAIVNADSLIGYLSALINDLFLTMKRL